MHHLEVEIHGFPFRKWSTEGVEFPYTLMLEASSFGSSQYLMASNSDLSNVGPSLFAYQSYIYKLYIIYIHL